MSKHQLCDSICNWRIHYTGAKKAVELSENTAVFRAMGSKLTSTPFPGCEDHPPRSDAYWECYHRHLSLTIVNLRYYVFEF